MIQSDKFDSLKMNIKKIANIAFEFTIKRLIEIFGFCVLLIGILLFITLVSYSPEDPNFIFPENTEIKNLLGYQGSFISDLFLQSIGYISYLIPFTLVFTGINIFKDKSFFLIIENIFFIILYSFFGSLFLSFFYQDAFTLYINGNGGFVGNYLNQTFLNDIIILNINISYYSLILLIIFLFLVSINFNLQKFLNTINKFIYFFQRKIITKTTQIKLKS